MADVKLHGQKALETWGRLPVQGESSFEVGNLLDRLLAPEQQPPPDQIFYNPAASDSCREIWSD